MEYKVTWSIEVDAESPKDAARISRQIQLDSNSTATVFDVTDEKGNVTTVDLRESTVLDTEPFNIKQLDEDRWHQENDDPLDLSPPW